MSSLKRKRNELDDSDDDDEPSFGRQILPVANLPENYDGIPSDGMEYLFTVRRDARQLPHVTFVPNPFERPEPVLPRLHNLNTTHPSLPSAEWCSLFEARFRNLRLNIMQPTIHVDIPPSNGRRLMPDKQERSLWWEFLAGKPESVWNSPKKLKTPKQKKLGRGMRAFNDDETTLNYDQPSTVPQQSVHEGVDEPSESKESGLLPSASCSPLGTKLSNKLPLYKHLPPTPSLLRRIDERMSLHLLMYFTYWINLHLEEKREVPFPRLRQTHAQWIFALLTRVEDHISADDMALLRNLSRACLALLKVIIRSKVADLPVGENSQVSEGRDLDNDGPIDQTSCWMIIRVVVGVWNQRDLWMDAEDMLRSLDS